ncbi:MAG: carbamoyltransferase [Magnetococcales bacterium]|nr:carbamoyltransferase [Magnetococcales bacterium]
MKNGHYLSVYSHIGDLAYLKNIGLRHDQNMALWRKEANHVELVHYWELERVSGHKNHSNSFFSTVHAQQVINTLLEEVGLSLDDMVAVWGTPGLSTISDTEWQTQHPQLPHHGLMHLFSSILLDTDIFHREKIIALAVDGAPDNVIDTEVRQKNYYVGGYSNRGQLALFPISSPGVLWALMRQRYQLNEGSLMALGSASQSNAWIEMEYPLSVTNTKDIIDLGEWFEAIAQRIESISACDAGTLMNAFDSRFSVEDNQISMVVKIIHKTSLMIMEQTIDGILKKHHLDPRDTYLALSGGYALNCPANAHLMRKYQFKGFMAPPCLNDSGMSLGMGLYQFHTRLKQFDFHFRTPYHGSADDALDTVLADAQFSDFVESVQTLHYDQVVDDLLQAPIIWFQGRAEMGPRALGNRSLLADPRNLAARDALNAIKQRQWWRPVAPIVLQERMHEWFEDIYNSPYMLHTFKISAEKKETVAAICHLDGTARVQTLSMDDNPALHHLLSAFYQRTGVPILGNTSLNDRGEPIINTIPEALNFALRKEIRIVYINNCRIELKNCAAYNETHPLQRTGVNIDPPAVNDPVSMEKKLNPHQLSRYDLMFYYHNPRLHRYDPSNAGDAHKLQRLIARIKRKTQNRADLQFIDLWHFVEHSGSGPLD